MFHHRSSTFHVIILCVVLLNLMAVVAVGVVLYNSRFSVSPMMWGMMGKTVRSEKISDKARVEGPLFLYARFTPRMSTDTVRAIQLLRERSIDPELDYIFIEKYHAGNPVVAVVISPDKNDQTDLRYEVFFKNNLPTPLLFGSAFRNRSTDGWFIPSCMGICTVPRWYAEKYPEVIHRAGPDSIKVED